MGRVGFVEERGDEVGGGDVEGARFGRHGLVVTVTVTVTVTEGARGGVVVQIFDLMPAAARKCTQAQGCSSGTAPTAPHLVLPCAGLAVLDI
jgi:hypothetical protein